MHYPKHFILTFCFLIIVGCATSNVELYALKKYQTANPELDFERDIANKNIHFLGVRGFAFEIPEIGLIQKEVCFKNVEVKSIDNTGDSFDEDIFKAMDLKSGARRYAGEYNTLLKTFLVNQGGVNCNPKARWDLAFSELNDFIWGFPIRHGSGLGMQIGSPPSFTISLVDLALTEQTTMKACKIFNKHGVDTKLIFNLDEHKKINENWIRTKVATFHCEHGNRSKLNYL